MLKLGDWESGVVAADVLSCGEREGLSFSCWELGEEIRRGAGLGGFVGELREQLRGIGLGNVAISLLVVSVSDCTPAVQTIRVN